MNKRRLGEHASIGDTPEIAYYHHPMDDIDPPTVLMIPADDAASAIRFILCEIIDSDSKSYAALRCRIIAMSYGMIISTETMAELARAYGVTRASISKQIRNRQNKAQIVCTRINKRAGTSDTYRLANIRRRKHEFDG